MEEEASGLAKEIRLGWSERDRQEPRTILVLREGWDLNMEVEAGRRIFQAEKCEQKHMR